MADCPLGMLLLQRSIHEPTDILCSGYFPHFAVTTRSTGYVCRKALLCEIRHEGLGPRCQTCWAYIGGEGGRVACAVALGPGSARYGKCDEQRNRPC